MGLARRVRFRKAWLRSNPCTDAMAGRDEIPYRLIRKAESTTP